MDLALTINASIDEEIIFAQQVGARQVFAQVTDQPAGPALAALKNRVEKAGLSLAGLHAAAPVQQAEPLAWLTRLAQEAGAARIGLLSVSPALLTPRRAIPPATEAELTGLAHSAAQAGVKLALPPRQPIRARRGKRATAQPLTPDALLHGLPAPAGLDGPANLLLACLQDSAEPAQHQRLMERLYLVSFENEPCPAVPTTLVSAGFDALLLACWQLRQAGYAGLVRLGQPAQWKGDTRQGHQARAFTTGYLRAVLRAF